jgi:WD40 repeat protein/serine/threonine protein kinase
VATLLRAQEEAPSFLEAPPPGIGATVDVPTLNEKPGAVIGPYKLLEQIGEGGMGTVWMAQQTAPVKRLVAVKVIKPGMDSAQVIARFEAERQALALMDHPNIARVLDGGTTGGGRLYFVMDLVKGVAITRYCDEHHLTPRQRLELFIPVCQAIQHAHQKGIIHRDLKPSNVLVALYDGKSVPKVIDFGVAKAAGQSLTDKTLVTGFGNIVGTLEYMSPEQAEINQLDIDTRSDIYSLGVLLYELLAGSPPFTQKDLEKAGMLEMLRVIREEEPSKPSTKLSTADGLPTLAANRGMEPAKLTRLVRGELDWIVMKALEKDRNRRYETANGLAMDVQRYLADEPVQACPPSAWYRVRKFARRNKGPLLAVALVLLALVGGIVGTSLGLVQAERARQDETAARDKLQVNLYYQTMALAEREHSAGNIGRAEQLLDSDLCPPALRGWEWQYLKGLSRGNAPLFRGQSVLFSLALAPDASRVAAGGSDGSITVWDTRTGQARVYQGHAAIVWGLVFCLDGQRLWSGGEDGVIHLWDLRTGNRLASVGHAPAGEEAIRGLALSPDGHYLVSMSGSRLQVWDAATGQRLEGGVEAREFDRGVAFSQDGRLLATTCKDKVVRIWDTATWRERFALRGHGGALVLGVAFSPDGRRLASGSVRYWDDSQDSEVIIWDLETQEPIQTLRGMAGGTRSVAFSPDGRRLATGAEADPIIRVWDVATGREALTLRGHQDAVLSLAFSRDGNRLFSASGDQTVRVWDGTPTPQRARTELQVLRGHEGRVNSLAFTQDGRRLVSGGTDRTVRLWDVRTGRELRTLIRGPSPVYAVAISPDGASLATGSYCAGEGPPQRPELRVWDARTWQERLCLALPNGEGHGIVSLAFSADSRRLVLTGTGSPSVVDVATGLALLSLEPEENQNGWAVAYGSRGRIAWATASGKVLVWDDPSAQVFGPIIAWVGPAPLLPKLVNAWVAGVACRPNVLHAHSTRALGVTLSSDQSQLASCGMDGTIKVIDRGDADWAERFTLRGHLGAVHAITFHPDGRRLASAGLDGTVRVWDMATSKELFSLHGHTNGVYCVAYSPDGSYLASGSSDGTIRIWDANPMPGQGETAP